MVVLLPRNEALKHDRAQNSLTMKTYRVNADAEVDGSNHYDEDNHFEEQITRSLSQPRGMRSTEHDDFASHNQSLCEVDIYTCMQHRPAEQVPQQPTTTTTTTPSTRCLLLRVSRLSSPRGALAVTDAFRHTVPAQSLLSICPAVSHFSCCKNLFVSCLEASHLPQDRSSRSRRSATTIYCQGYF